MSRRNSPAGGVKAGRNGMAGHDSQPAPVMTKGNDPAALPKGVASFSKLDYVLIGVLLSGGARQFVDAEDVAVICFKLNRTAFRWSRYDYPHLQTVLIAFRHLKVRFGEDILVAPSPGSTERRLTALGLKRAIALSEIYIGRHYKDANALVSALRRKLSDSKDVVPSSQPEAKSSLQARDARATLSFITGHAAYRAWVRGSLDDLPLWQIADVLQCLPDSPPAVWRERLARYQSLAAWWNRTKAQEFLNALQLRINILTEA